MTAGLRYLYAVADAPAAPRIAEARLSGIEGGIVEPIVEGRVLAATSAVPVSDYEEAPLNEHLQDMDWLAPRAATHQDVNAKLLELTGGIVPLSFGAIYRDREGIRAMLRARAPEFVDRLDELRGRAEWIVSIERGLATTQESDALRGLGAKIAKAPPGRAFLLTKRREEVAREERRAWDAEVAEDAAAALAAVADRVYREELIDDSALSAVARFSVLVERSRDPELARAIERLSAADTPRGYHVRLSGPWPAYRFGGLPRERVPSG